jgi:hypothetical protein
MDNLTRLLKGMEPGDLNAAAQLFQLVCDDLSRLAAHCLAHEAPGQPLEPTGPGP